MQINLSNLNLNHLYHFYVIADCQSLKIAAEKLNLSAPALSHSLRKLEGHFGEKLCLRNQVSFNLTPTGERVYQYTSKIIDELQKLHRIDTAEEVDSIFSIAMIDHQYSQKMDQILFRFIQKFPNIYLDLQIRTEIEMFELLRSGNIHVAFGPLDFEPTLSFTNIDTYTMEYYISKNHPLWDVKAPTKKQLNEVSVIRMDINHHNLQSLQKNFRFDNTRTNCKASAFAYGLSSAMKILDAGHGATALPSFLPQTQLKNYKKIKLIAQPLKQDLKMAFNPLRVNSEQHRYFIELCRE